jgi:hypothetical protein
VVPTPSPTESEAADPSGTAFNLRLSSRRPSPVARSDPHDDDHARYTLAAERARCATIPSCAAGSLPYASCEAPSTRLCPPGPRQARPHATIQPHR